MNFLEFLRLSLGNIISDCYQASHEGILWRNMKEIIQFRWLQFWCSYKGLKQSAEIDYHLRQRFYYPNELNKNEETGRSSAEKVNYMMA
jgi:hypothetical protein